MAIKIPLNIDINKIKFCPEGLGLKETYIEGKPEAKDYRKYPHLICKKSKEGEEKTEDKPKTEEKTESKEITKKEELKKPIKNVVMLTEFGISKKDAIESAQ